MRLPTLLRPSPSLRDIERALLAELARYPDDQSQTPNTWGVTLSPRDTRRHSADLPAWSGALADSVLSEQRRLGLPTAGLVTVGFDARADVEPGTFQVRGAVMTGGVLELREEATLPGRPRLTLAAGGSVRHGTPTAAGLDHEVLLRPGSLVIGRAKDADMRLDDPSLSPRHVELLVTGDRVRLYDLGSLNGTLVDGVPSLAVDLVDGNRITLGQTALTFHRDAVDDDGGREGGEGE